jgi:DNA-binding transcriptional LysR family regulator
MISITLRYGDIMNLRQIEVFRAMMIAGSVTAAADLLNVSQPGVSRMLAHIELQLGLKLFQRQRGKLHPTPEANALYAQVEQVFHWVQQIAQCADQLKRGGGLLLRVLCSPSLALNVLPQAIANTSMRYPKASLHLEAQLAREISTQLLAGDADLAFTTLAIDHPLLHSKPIGQWTLRCVMLAQHPLAKRTLVQPSDLLQENLIAFSPDTPQGKAVSSWQDGKKANTPARIEVRSGQIACELVSCGAGIAVVDSLTAKAWRSPGLVFRPIAQAPKYSAFEIRPSKQPASRLASYLSSQVQIGIATPA